MQKLKDTHSPDRHETALRFVDLRLASRPQCADIRAEVKGLRTRLDGSVRTYKEAREARVAATVELDYSGVRLGRELAGVARPSTPRTRRPTAKPESAPSEPTAARWR